MPSDVTEAPFVGTFAVVAARLVCDHRKPAWLSACRTKRTVVCSANLRRGGPGTAPDHGMRQFVTLAPDSLGYRPPRSSSGGRAKRRTLCDSRFATRFASRRTRRRDALMIDRR